MKGSKRLIRISKTFFLCTFIVATIHTNAYSQHENKLLLKSAKLFDSKKGKFIDQIDILIENDNIQSVKENINIDSLRNTRVIDLSGYTIVPGLIDLHTHVLENLSTEIPGGLGLVTNILTHHDVYRAARSVPYLLSYLNEGFTTIRDVGNSGSFGDVALKKAINEGFISSPRLVVSGPILSSAGGQITGILGSHQKVIGEEYRIIKNKDDAIQAVREHINQGVDFIKICTDNSPNRTYLTINEIKAITNTAHEYGKKVTAHANTPQSIQNAIEGGVDGIEHGYLVTQELAKKLKEQNISVTSTDFYLSQFGKKYLIDTNTPEASINFIQHTVSKRLKLLVENNNHLVFGSDVYVETDVPRGTISKDILISYNKDYHIPIVTVLQMATYNAALSLGQEAIIGHINSGLKADMVILKGDLESDISILKNIHFIIKDGSIYYPTKGRQD